MVFLQNNYELKNRLAIIEQNAPVELATRSGRDYLSLPLLRSNWKNVLIARKKRNSRERERGREM